MSKSFQVVFANNDKKKLTFALTADMKTFLSNLELDDVSDMDFTLNGTDSIKLHELLDLQDETAEFETIIRYLTYLSDPLAISRMDEPNNAVLYNSAVHGHDIFVFYGKIIFVGQPKPSQNNTRWVRFDVKSKQSTDILGAFRSGTHDDFSLWIKQEMYSEFNCANWINKYVRVIGTLHEKWIVKVFQIIAEDRTVYNAGGPRL